MIDTSIINRNSKCHKADYYVKRFKAKDHLISMLFCVFAKCSSLREVAGAMLGLSGKTRHFQLSHIPYRSTLSDANKRRTADFFAGVYLTPNENTIYVLDKGYNDYKAFKLFGEKGAGFVTRIKDNAVYKVEEELYVDRCIHSGVLEDTIIKIAVKEEDGNVSKLKLRKVVFYERVLKRKFEFLTNLFEMRPDMIAAIYKIQ